MATPKGGGVTLPASVIREDKKLENAASKSTEELARLRWHWTVDESNPKRVSFTEYGRQVGLSHANIAVYAKGYAEWMNARMMQQDSALTDCIALQRYGKDKRAVMEAYTDETGHNPRGLRGSDPLSKQKRATIKAAHEVAKTQAAKNGTSIAEEAPAAVAKVLKDKATAEKEKAKRDAAEQARLKKHTAEARSASAEFQRARQALTNALGHVKGVEFNDYDRELLTDSFMHLEGTFRIIRTEIIGDSGVDWDAALAGMTGGGK